MHLEKSIRNLAGVQIPYLIYGTAWKETRTADLVFKAISYGFRGIDTACQPKHYNEPGVGEALSRLKDIGIGREDLFLQTKFTPLAGHDPQRVPYDRRASLADQVVQSFSVSQKNLGTEYVDSLVLHSPLTTLNQLMEVWEAMERICRSGGAKQIGISNCYDLSLMKELYERATVKPAVLQNRFYSETHYDHDLRRWCREHGVVYQSFWTLSANPHILQHAVVQKAASDLSKTAAQVFFRFLVQSGVVPLTGTCSEQHMKDDLAVLDFILPPTLVGAIDEILTSS